MTYRIDRLGHLLHDASRTFRRLFEERTAGYGLSATQWRLLGLVVREGPLAQSQIAERLDVEPISVSRLVDRMEKAGWVRREGHPQDRRTRLVIPSDHARGTVEQVRHVVDDLAESVLAGFSDEERRSLHRLLVALAETPKGDMPCPPNSQDLK